MLGDWSRMRQEVSLVLGPIDGQQSGVTLRRVPGQEVGGVDGSQPVLCVEGMGVLGDCRVHIGGDSTKPLCRWDFMWKVRWQEWGASFPGVTRSMECRLGMERGGFGGGVG